MGDTFLCVGFICLGRVSQVLPASHLASDTLHSRLILSRHHSSTHLKNVWNIKQQARISAFVDDI